MENIKITRGLEAHSKSDTSWGGGLEKGWSYLKNMSKFELVLGFYKNKIYSSHHRQLIKRSLKNIEKFQKIQFSDFVKKEWDSIFKWKSCIFALLTKMSSYAII